MAGLTFEDVKRVKCKWKEGSIRADCRLDLRNDERETVEVDSLRINDVSVNETYNKTSFFSPIGKMECDVTEGQLSCSGRVGE